MANISVIQACSNTLYKVLSALHQRANQAGGFACCSAAGGKLPYSVHNANDYEPNTEVAIGKCGTSTVYRKCFYGRDTGGTAAKSYGSIGAHTYVVNMSAYAQGGNGALGYRASTCYIKNGNLMLIFPATVADPDCYYFAYVDYIK